MHRDVLRESWVYQEIGQKYLREYLEQGFQKGFEEAFQAGFEEGQAQGFHQVLLLYMETRFPTLVTLAKQQTDSITDPMALNHIISKLFALQTAEEVEQYLRTLERDETKN